MAYIDSQRAKAIEDFKVNIIQNKLEPYHSFIEKYPSSEQLLIQCYHDHYYQQYYTIDKQQRQQNFWQQWQKLKLKDSLLTGLYTL
ncbi:MAG: hypothetical protein VKL42_05125 [Snowella sp.]|nr:hypothetical protein [Snowella sp.]